MNEFVSIIVPAYNSSAFIGQTLDSFLAQTHANWEAIVVDDGSTDETFVIVESYAQKDRRIRPFHRPDEYRPGGRGAKNFGFTLARGTLVNFFDSDDLMAPSFLEKKAEVLGSDRTLDFVLSNFYWKTRAGRPLREFNYKKVPDELGAQFWAVYLKMGFFMNPCGPLWRKSFLDGKALWDEETRIGEDWEFHGRMLLNKAKFKIIHEPLWYYMARDDSMMGLRTIESVSSRAQARIKLFWALQAAEIDMKRLNIIELRWQAKIIRQMMEVVREMKTLQGVLEFLRIVPMHLRWLLSIPKSAFTKLYVSVRVGAGILIFLLSGKGQVIFEFNHWGETAEEDCFDIQEVSPLRVAGLDPLLRGE